MPNFKEIRHLYDTVEQLKLGADLHRLVGERDIAKHLRMRHMLGALAQYGSQTDGKTISQRSVFANYKKNTTGELGVFVLSDNDDFTIGLATIDPNPSLGRLRVPIVPPRLVPRILRQDKSDIALAGPEIKAWVVPSLGTESLSATYQALMMPDGPAHKFYEQYAAIHNIGPECIRPWTVEPGRTPQMVRSAILSSGLTDAEQWGRYDDGESGVISPPLGVLYLPPQ
jgi:hypothetical protein